MDRYKGQHMVKKAIFPVGGLGTRFLPATKALPKEMLPIVDKPLIQYAVEEAIEAGIEEFIFVEDKFFYASFDGLFDSICLLYTSPSPRDRQKSRMPSSA